MAAATKTPVTPNAVGVAPVTHCQNGCSRPVVWRSSESGCDGGMNGERLAALTKKMPTTMTKRQTDTLMATRALVTHFDSRMPTAATTPRTSAMPSAPRLTLDSSPKNVVGSENASWR